MKNKTIIMMLPPPDDVTYSVRDMVGIEQIIGTVIKEVATK